MLHLPVNSFSPPCPCSGCGCKVPEPFAPMLLWVLEELSSTQGTGSRGPSTSRCPGLWGAGANAVARTGCVPGPQNTQLAATSPLQGLPTALSLLDVAHRPFALMGPAQRGVAVAPLHPWVPPSTLPQGFSQPSCSFPSLGRGALTWHTALASVQVCSVEGWLCLALCSCMQLLSLPHSTGPGQCSGSGLLRAALNKHNSLFPCRKVHKSTNCEKEKDKWFKGQMSPAGLNSTEGFPRFVHGCNPIKLSPAHIFL